MKRSLILTFAAALLAAFVGCVAPALAAEFTPEQKAEIGAIMKDYLINNPDVLRAAIEALDKHDKQVEAEARQSAVADQSGALFSSAHQANVGNPKGRRDARRVLRLQLPLLQRRAARYGQADAK